MFSTIMVPVDLAHAERLEKALDLAAQLAKAHSARIIYAGVTASRAGSVAHSPQEFDLKLTAFADAQAALHGIETGAATFVSHDPAVDTDDTLLEAIESTGADLCVMQSHIPNVADYLWSSNGAKVARYAKISVFIVR